MNQATTSSVCASLLMLLSGCFSMQTNTQPPAISEEAVPSLEVTQTVALRNSAPNEGEASIGGWFGWTVYGDLHAYTESSLGAAKNVFERENIQVKDAADKVLELAVIDATCEKGWWNLRVSSVLRVTTGDGLVKEYEASQKYMNGYGTTPAMERTLARGVAQMLTDEEVLRYLQD